MSPSAVIGPLSPRICVTTASPELTPMRIWGRTPCLASIADAAAASRSWIASPARQARSGASSSASGTPNSAMMPSPVKSLTEPPCSLTARGHQFIDRLDQRERALLAEPLGDRGEADHVREQRRHLPPLARRRGRVRGSGAGLAHLNAPQRIGPLPGGPSRALCGRFWRNDSTV